MHIACSYPRSAVRYSNFFRYNKSSDFREQFDEVLRLRAALTTEVEALEQLRAELEDSESMSEVHIQLERATLENKRLQSVVRVAHEQGEVCLVDRLICPPFYVTV